MAYIAGDIFYKIFVTNLSGVSTNADSLPKGVLSKNGVDDASASVFVANIDAGRYNISGIIPSTYVGGNSIAITASGTVGGIATKAVFDLGVLDRPFSITGVAPANFIGTNAISPGVTISVTGLVSANVVSFSGSPVAAANSSGCILADMRFVNFYPISPYNGIAQSGGINWIQLSQSEPALDNYYKYVQINLVGNVGQGQWGLISAYSGSTRTAYITENWITTPYSGTQYSFQGIGLTNSQFIQDQLLSNKVGTNFNTFFQDGGNTTVQIVDNIGTGGGSGTADWTSTERSQIRYLLGVDGAATIPATAKPAITVSTTGTVQSNVISFSGVNVSAPDQSGAILADVRFVNGNPASTYNGVAQSGGTNWIQLASTEPTIDNYYKNEYVYLAGGQGVGQWGLITAYSGSIRTAYIDHNWYVLPYNNTKYLLGGYGVAATILNPIATTSSAITGSAPANFLGIGSISQGVTVSVTGIVQANVISFSGSPVVAANQSGAVISDIRYIQGQLSTLYDGVAQSGTINTIQLAQKEPPVDQYYQWCYISVLAASGGYQYGLVTSYSGANRTAYMDRNWSITPDNNGNTNYTFIGYARDNPIYINNQLLSNKAGLNFNTFFQNAGNTTVDIVDNVGTGGSGSGITDWTLTERSQIRYLLGVDGASSIPATAKPALTVSATGTVQSNVISFSGSPVASADQSGAILADVRFINGNPASTFNGTALSGGVNWIKLASTEPVINDYYKNEYIYLAGGQGVGQWGLITTYSGSTQTAYIDHNWYVLPYNDTKYLLGGYGVASTVINSQTFTGTTAITGSAPSNFLGIGSVAPGVTVSVTGIPQVNVVSMNPGLTISITGVVPNVLNVLNPVGVTGTVQANVITISGSLVAAPDGSGFILTDVRAINNSFLGNKTGPNFNIFFQNANNTTSEVVDNVGTGGSSSGTTDWTTTERNQIRYLLGVDGVASIPSVAKPAITVAVTGTSSSVNVTSISPGVTVSITGTNIFSSTDLSQIRYKLGLDGTATTPSNPYASKLELSQSGVSNIMVENGVNMNQWMEAMGAVIAGSSTVNGNNITYYAMNHNNTSRVQSTSVSGAREVVVLLL